MPDYHDLTHEQLTQEILHTELFGYDCGRLGVFRGVEIEVTYELWYAYSASRYYLTCNGYYFGWSSSCASIWLTLAAQLIRVPDSQLPILKRSDHPYRAKTNEPIEVNGKWTYYPHYARSEYHNRVMAELLPIGYESFVAHSLAHPFTLVRCGNVNYLRRHLEYFWSDGYRIAQISHTKSESLGDYWTVKVRYNFGYVGSQYYWIDSPNKKNPEPFRSLQEVVEYLKTVKEPL